MGTRWRQDEVRPGSECRRDPEKERSPALWMAGGVCWVDLQEVEEELMVPPTSWLNTL